MNVVVVGCWGARNFGDRLGVHVLSGILPSSWKIEWVENRRAMTHPETLEKDWDLAIIGIGNSFYRNFGPQLVDLAKRSRRAIGIFGTQYHNPTDLESLHSLLSELDHWYARYSADLDWAENPVNASLLGDWLITQFPLVRWRRDETFNVPRKHFALDRLIYQIQSYRRVASPKIHPLLCALTSAEEVQYREQRDMNYAPGKPSGKFSWMLTDVLGGEFPEGEWFAVDHERVAQYRDVVMTRVRRLQMQMSALIA